MSWNLVRLSDIAATPWKNGGGTTRELVTWPDSRDWIARLSVAEVTQGGPFSVFAGVHRWFAVLSGRGVQLTLNQGRHVLHEATPPFDFAGDTPVDCQLLDGPTQDFNLMVKQGVQAQMSRINGAAMCTLKTPKTIAVYAVNTWARVLFGTNAWRVEPDTLIWQHLPTGSQVQVQAENALWMEIDR